MTTLTTTIQDAAGVLVGALGGHITYPKVKPLIVKPPWKMYDSVTLDNLPEGGDYYVAYVNGWSEVSPSKVHARFPKAKVLTFATDAAYLAQILDVERGAATVKNIPAWWQMVTDYGIEPKGVYASLSNMPAVLAQFKAMHVKRSTYVLIVADWNGSPTVPSGYDGHQYLSTAKYDASVLSRKSFG